MARKNLKNVQPIEKLVFGEVEFEVIDQNGQTWLKANQIAQALGYNKFKGPLPTDTPFEGSAKLGYTEKGYQTDTPHKNQIRTLYARHADEFTDSMTTVITLTTSSGPQETRIFSLRGCKSQGVSSLGFGCFGVHGKIDLPTAVQRNGAAGYAKKAGG